MFLKDPVYSDCVFAALVIQHATRTRRIVNYGQSGSNVFVHIISQMALFSEKLLNIKRVFRFSLQLLSGTFTF